MSAIQWGEHLNVGVEFMDADHVEAARLINAMAEASGPALLDLARHFLAHCREHFHREEEMMKATGFFAAACHAGEHERVLGELGGVVARLEAGEEAALKDYFAAGLSQWLMNHRNTMDFVTAEFARNAGWL